MVVGCNGGWVRAGVFRGVLAARQTSEPSPRGTEIELRSGLERGCEQQQPEHQNGGRAENFDRRADPASH